MHRRLAEDTNLRARHPALYEVLDQVRGRAQLPRPSPEVVRSASALLREAGAAYSPVHSLLKVAHHPDLVVQLRVSMLCRVTVLASSGCQGLVKHQTLCMNS